MYSAWKITVGENGNVLIIYGKEEDVEKYKKEHLENEDFGGGFDGRTEEEIKNIVNSLTRNYPNAQVKRV